MSAKASAPIRKYSKSQYGSPRRGLLDRADGIAPFLACFQPRWLQPGTAFTGKLHHSITMFEEPRWRWLCAVDWPPESPAVCRMSNASRAASAMAKWAL